MVSRQRGFTYLAVLFAMAILASGLGLAGEMWDTAAQREREAELLFVGNQYRMAIQRYYFAGTQRRYPGSLEDLLEDPRRPSIDRHLRTLYPDPITGGGWTLIKGPQGGIVGVHSASEARPLKGSGFKPRDSAFEGAQRYSDWKFVVSAK